MKNILVLFLLFFLFFSLSAQIVSSDEARSAAINFWYERVQAFEQPDRADIIIQNINTYENEEEIYYYIINLSPKGFVIVSAEKNTLPIIAYSFNGYFDPDIKSPSVKSWMKKYEVQIHQSRNSDFNNSETHYEWERLLNAHNKGFDFNFEKGIEPLLFSTWDQGNFYNTSCPEDPTGPNGHTLTGCVATALGQLLHYWRYPTQGDSSYSYFDENYGQQSVNFNEQTYCYEEMPNHPTDHYPELTKLLYHIGVSVDMHYGPDGSGMTNHKAAYSMRTFFRYSDSTQYIFRDSVEIDWQQELINHLDSGVPLYYAGWSDEYFISGHAFVCDGYQDSDYFHFNWGWGGSYDGYFYLDNLSPGGSNFNLMHEMVANMKPRENFPLFFSGTKFLNTNEGTIDDGSGPVHDYRSNVDCSWQITSEDSISSIRLNFLRFDLALGDTLKVYNGTDENGILINEYTGSIIPETIDIEAEDLFLWFTSDFEDTASGFLIEYIADQAEFCSVYEQVTEPEGLLSDGSGTYNYLNSVICRWYLTAPGASNYDFHFTEFDLEDNNDVLKFLDQNYNLIHSFSGNNLPEDFNIEAPSVYISFETNNEITAEGWKLSYHTDQSSIIENLSTNNAFSVFPNPANDIINIDHMMVTDDFFNISLYSLQGKRHISLERTHDFPVTINCEALDSGFYMIIIESETNIYYKKIIII